MNERILLLRQIHPHWIQSKKVTSQAFKPTSKDNKQLSFYDGDQITAEASWQHYTETLECQSAGVMAVSVKECQSLTLPVKPDPSLYPQHVIVEFVDCSRSAIEIKAKQLKLYAEARGWQYEAK